MPKLPGAEDLGQAPSGRSGRPIATADVSAIGRGIATLGAGMQWLAGDLRDMEKNKKAEVDKAGQFEAQRRFLEFSAKQDDTLQQERQKAQPGAFGFREGFTRSYQQSAREFLATVPDALKPEYDVKLFQVEDTLAGKALEFERDQRKGYYTNTVNDGLVLIENKLYENPSAFDANLKEGNAFIDAIPDEDVSPIAKEDMRRQWKQKAQLAALNGLPPVARIEALGGEVSGSRAITSVVDRIIGVESGGNASAKNPRSSASGLGQFTDSTWLATIKKHRPDLAGMRTDELLELKNSPSIGREMTVRHTEDNARALSAAGHAVNAGNLYLAHFAGVGGAKEVLKADPSASVSSVLGMAVIKANPFLAGKDVAWLRDWASKKMGSGQVSPQFADMPWNEREKVVKQAETEQKQADAEARVTAQFEIENALTNAPVAIQNTGEYLGQMPTQEQFMAAYGDQAIQKFKEFQQAIETSQQAFQMQTMPAEEIASLVKSAKPDSSGDDAALQQERYEVLSRAADATIKARNDDPALYVRRVFPAVDTAWSTVQAGENYTSAVALSIAAQEQLGIADIKPLPKDAAEYSVERFKDANLPETERFSALTSALMSTPDAGQRRAIFEQLVDAGLPEITEGAVEALSRGDSGAARRLFQAAVIDPSKLPGQSPEKPAAIDEAIQASLMDAGQVGDIYYGLSDGTAENFVRAERDSKLLSNAVNLRIRNGEGLEDAVNSAAKDLYGDVQVVDSAGNLNAQVLIPATEDADAVSAGLAALAPRVKEAVTKAMPAVTGAPTKDGTKAILDAATSSYIDNVLAEGFFRNTSGGFVFIDPYIGAAVSDGKGNPIIFTIDDVLAAQPKRDARTPSGPLTDDAFDRFHERMGAQ